jgi:hypothetical protein
MNEARKSALMGRRFAWSAQNAQVDEAYDLLFPGP